MQNMFEILKSCQKGKGKRPKVIWNDHIFTSLLQLSKWGFGRTAKQLEPCLALSTCCTVTDRKTRLLMHISLLVVIRLSKSSSILVVFELVKSCFDQSMCELVSKKISCHKPIFWQMARSGTIWAEEQGEGEAWSAFASKYKWNDGQGIEWKLTEIMHLFFVKCLTHIPALQNPASGEIGPLVFTLRIICSKDRQQSHVNPIKLCKRTTLSQTGHAIASGYHFSCSDEAKQFEWHFHKIRNKRMELLNFSDADINPPRLFAAPLTLRCIFSWRILSEPKLTASILPNSLSSNAMSEQVCHHVIWSPSFLTKFHIRWFLTIASFLFVLTTLGPGTILIRFINVSYPSSLKQVSSGGWYLELQVSYTDTAPDNYAEHEFHIFFLKSPGFPALNWTCHTTVPFLPLLELSAAMLIFGVT